MKVANRRWLLAGKWMGVCLIAIACASISYAQAFSTTTVQGTVYLANGTPGAGTLQLSWPAFTTANNQSVAAGRITCDHRRGRFCEREPGAQRGLDAGRSLLHGRLLHERRHNQHRVLGCSRSRAGNNRASTCAGNALGAGRACSEPRPMWIRQSNRFHKVILRPRAEA